MACDKKDEKDDVSPTDKKGKRGSVFGSLFKNRVTSPTAEKSERDAMTNGDVAPVSDTAPRIEEPIENKPIDTAALTAPTDTVATPPAAEEPTTAHTTEAPKTEKKGGLLGFMKKNEGKKEAKEEAKEDRAAATIANDPIAAASAEPTEAAATHHAVTMDPTTESSSPTTEDRPARENKRSTSLFFNKKQPVTSEADDTITDPKREKSPLPGGKFIGGLVRRASRAIKSEGSKEKTPPAEPTPAAHVNGTTEAATDAPAVAPETTETKPTEHTTEPIHSTHEPLATATPEVKATA